MFFHKIHSIILPSKTSQDVLLSLKTIRNISKSLNTSFTNECQRKDRLLLRIPLSTNQLQCRGLSNDTKSKFSNWWNRLKTYLEEPSSCRFEPSNVERVFKFDKKNLDEWLLIYRDAFASRMSLLFSIVFPMFAVLFLVIFFDIHNNENPRDRFTLTRRLTNDFLELGVLAVIPVTLIIFVATTLLRVNYLKPLRIYQSLSDPDNYVVVVSQFGRFHKQIHFTHNNPNDKKYLTSTAIGSLEYNEMKDIFRDMLYGNSQFANRKFLIDNECWRNNEVRDYLFYKN